MTLALSRDQTGSACIGALTLRRFTPRQRNVRFGPRCRWNTECGNRAESIHSCRSQTVLRYGGSSPVSDTGDKAEADPRVGVTSATSEPFCRAARLAFVEPLRKPAL